MKEVKAFIHRNRAADVVHGLRTAGFFAGACNLSLVDVAGTLRSLDSKEKRFSVEFGERLIEEVKLELVCDDDRVNEAITIIRQNGRTGQPVCGGVYVSEILVGFPIEP